MIDVVVPKWGLTMEDAVIVTWLKKVDDEVSAEEALAELEADKIEGEVESPAAGRLAEILAEEGATVEPGQVIARIDPA